MNKIFENFQRPDAKIIVLIGVWISVLKNNHWLKCRILWWQSWLLEHLYSLSWWRAWRWRPWRGHFERLPKVSSWRLHRPSDHWYFPSDMWTLCDQQTYKIWWDNPKSCRQTLSFACLSLRTLTFGVGRQCCYVSIYWTPTWMTQKIWRTSSIFVNLVDYCNNWDQLTDHHQHFQTPIWRFLLIRVPKDRIQCP